MHLNSEYFEYIVCNLCGSDKYDIVVESQYDLEKDANLSEKYRSSGDETLIDQVVRCSKCGLVYVNPRLKENLILEGYAQGSDEIFVSQAEAREKTFHNSLDLIESFVRTKGEILDIGTAAGSFLYAAKNRGWGVSGCEPNRWLCEWGTKHYGIQIDAGTVFEQNYASAAFDVVTLWDVLEHACDPKRVVDECARLLKPGGILVVNYPDIDTWIAKLMGRRWVFWLSVHLFYFTNDTMRALLEKCGFRILITRPHFQRLSLDYILHRASAYIRAFGFIEGVVSSRLGLGKLQIPYWMGQTLVVARKDSADYGQ